MRTGYQLGLQASSPLGQEFPLVDWSLRNILAHEYLDFRWRQIEEFIANAPDVIHTLIESTEGLIDGTT